jgi:hypothetical protein
MLTQELVRTLQDEESTVVGSVVVEVDDALKAEETFTERVLVCERKKRMSRGV